MIAITADSVEWAADGSLTVPAKFEIHTERETVVGREVELDVELVLEPEG